MSVHVRIGERLVKISACTGLIFFFFLPFCCGDQPVKKKKIYGGTKTDTTSKP